ncbi:MAG TPA: hypothetical protein VFE98_00400 [Candidatus Bathyarchaeia archaeon]|nr:hypothetical protein [Candidatus Bathyarchaeia archaeon]
MNSRKIQTTLILTTLVLSSLLALPGVSVRGAGGISIAPTSRPLAVTGSTVIYKVNASGINPINGWDIAVVTDANVLTPMTISTAGNLVGTPTELANCVNGGAGIAFGQPGNIGCGINDGIGIVHSAAVFTSTPKGGNGTLFTINYLASNNGPGAVLAITNDILTNSGTIVAHTVTNGSYATPVADFSINSSPISVRQGTFATSTIVFQSFGGFTANLQIAITPNSAYNSFVLPTTVNLPAGGSVVTTLTVDVPLATATGSYPQLFRVTDLSATVAPKDSSVSVIVTVAANVGLTCPSALSIPAGTTGVGEIKAASQSGFFGAVFLSAGSVSGLTTSFAPPSLAVPAGRTISSILTVATTTTTAPGTYSLIVSANIGTSATTCSIPVTVLSSTASDFAIAASPTTVSLMRTATSPIALTVTGALASSTTLRSVITPTVDGGPTATLIGNTLTLAADANSQTGKFTVTVIGASGSQTHGAGIALNVIDFLIAPQDDLAIHGNDCDYSRFQVGSIGFSGTVQLTTTVTPTAGGSTMNATITKTNGVTVVTSVTLNALIPSQNFFKGLFKVCASNLTPGGTYTATTTGVGGGVTHENSINVDVSTFDISATPIVIQPGETARSTVTVSSSNGYSDNVTLTATSPNPMITVTLSKGWVVVPFGGSASVVATVTANANAQQGLYPITIKGVDKGLTSIFGVPLTRTGTLNVNVPSDTVGSPSTSVGLSVVSLSTDKGVETWTTTLINRGTTTQYVRFTVSGASTTGTRQFSTSVVVAVAAGATISVKLSYTFSAADKGLAFNFNTGFIFGPSATTFTQVGQDVANGSFQVVA